MSEQNVMKRLHGIGIIPAIALNHVEDAAPLAEALCKGGLPAAEVTYRTPAAHDAMIAMKKARPDLLVGAGTVLTREQVDSAIDAGAEFIVAPGLNPEVVKYVQSKGLPMIPGVANASEIEQALELGLHTVKFFPAEPLGGIKTIKALCGPYRNINFMPTGGVNEKNMNDYLASDKIFAVGGTWMVKTDMIDSKQFAELEKITHDAVLKMLGLRVKHVGVNATNDVASRTAQDFANIMLGNVRETNKGYFGSELVEVMSEGNWKGTKGHIAVGVNSVERAMAYYTALGYAFDESTIAYDEAGDAKFAYFKDEIAGFAIHLINN
ncbi:MAG: bifunctional 4-hydroxy-2-oxoglutarate aldolase/2-dehydro-3-deoxy-phosphogluconate aldolase [Solobacterium sp.]|jgi:2-dehydro-3-deoxyphosphogluconate aldolase/(4S)-4-hydroxy-2-oxoglutarate aldolase|nr:bifunctional 4-hydroxy-2-oxoglutarate aldolase/2-dehydro-3-deoxy-phosphogluconate aldolase [Solobacterium sp.]MCH4223038.1 bifunctional 4-hydroxy-2-oxoglutarate aldolase/2-dehydro-3-deoxy-phosphogluconate aldolase [Solobacterium sp.]MCH4266523.1 bifunctional 4-hydroxy-2-oxoglutarate aldolase/2-dehydro-3-deoxy-phosphogluconate aldolase [Solobacterium sp.]